MIIVFCLSILTSHFVTGLINSEDRCDFSLLKRVTKVRLIDVGEESLNLKCIIDQFSNLSSSSPALLSTSSDRMFSHQYLRVTLKSVLPINRFIIKAVRSGEHDDSGALGTWYLPFTADTGQTSHSRYLNCSGSVNNAVTNSDSISQGSDYVIFFQWSPDDEYDGEVVFTSLVMRGYRDFWENVTGIKVIQFSQYLTSLFNINQMLKVNVINNNKILQNISTSMISSITSLVNSSSTIKYLTDEETTRWSLYSSEESSTEESKDSLEPYQRLEAEQGGWERPRNCDSILKLEIFFMPILLTVLI